ncbi:hypothetical protein CR513_38891, partial [Mucuna pruriens]
MHGLDLAWENYALDHWSQTSFLACISMLPLSKSSATSFISTGVYPSNTLRNGNQCADFLAMMYLFAAACR